MDVYLKNEKANDTFHFPVNPFGITVDRKKRYETADIIGIGEIDFIDNSKKIKELSFDTLLPKEYDTYCRYVDIPKPIEIIKKLEGWIEQQEPLRLIITNFDFNDLVIISSMSEEERAKETGDKYITLNFRTWRQLKIEVLPPVNKPQDPPLNPNRPDPKPNPNTYVVKRGDCLWNIAKKFYGNGAKWTTIYNNEQNKSVIGRNPNLIYPGQKLVIP